MKIGTVPSGTTTTVTKEIELTYLPEILHWGSGGIQNFDRIEVEVLGVGLIMNLNEAGIGAIGGAALVGKNDDGDVFLRLADGKVDNVNVVIRITSSIAAVDIFAFSQSKTQGDQGGFYYKTISQTIFADSAAVFSDFDLLHLVNTTDNDNIQINYQDGLSDQFVPSDLPDYNSQYFGVHPSAGTIDQYVPNLFEVTPQVSRVMITPAAQRTIYKRSFLVFE